MTDLEFSVIESRADRYAASPSLVLRLRILEKSGAKVDAIALRAQIRIAVQRRRYAPDESALLEELFGTPDALRRDAKADAMDARSSIVTAFENATEIDLTIPCSYDFEVAAHKYLASLKNGIVPLELLFSGMVFVEGPGGVTPEFVPWSCEARYGLPVHVWRDALDAHFPNSAWIRVHRDTFDELRRFKTATGLPTWDAALERLCALGEGKAVNPFEPARKVADAVLYEGYILYPYTASAPKNRIRWQFGVVVPEAYAARGTGEPFQAQTEVLLECDARHGSRGAGPFLAGRSAPGRSVAAIVVRSGRVARARLEKLSDVR